MRPGWCPARVAVREVSEIAAAGLLSPIGWADRGHLTAARLVSAAGTAPPHRTPVVLVHGYAGHRANWLPLARRLTRAGFVDLHAMTYNAFTTPLPDIARALVCTCEQVLWRAGSDRVHVVGHSLGGLVIRYALQNCDLADWVGTAVTVAAPHRGTWWAWLGWGPVAGSLLPGSVLLDGLHRGARASGVRLVAYYSDADLVVGPHSARIEEEALHAVNHLIPGVGHLGILRAPAFLESVVAVLSEDTPPASSGSPSSVAA